MSGDSRYDKRECFVENFSCKFVITADDVVEELFRNYAGQIVVALSVDFTRYHCFDCYCGGRCRIVG